MRTNTQLLDLSEQQGGKRFQLINIYLRVQTSNLKMSSNYLFVRNDNYLTMVISGEYDRNQFMSFPELILKKCEEENVNKILVDGLAVQGTDIPTMDRFFIANNIASILNSKVKLAVVWPKEHINKFAETVAVNRGTSMIVVDTIDAAHTWLMEGNPTQ